jgi:agmatine deiminase
MEKRTPLEAGFEFPAEWEPHRATWLGWPYNKNDFPGKIATIHWVYGEITRKLIAAGERVAILVQDAKHETKARQVLTKVGADFEKIEFHRIAHDRGWMRDSGPMFVKNDSTQETAVVKFNFNAWAKYPDWKLDNQVAVKFAKKENRSIFKVRYAGQDVVLEGGAIDLNGAGAILTTEECLLDYKVQTRNPHLARADYERVFRENLGATNTLWLNKGIVGDDTHGHVDDFCRRIIKFWKKTANGSKTCGSKTARNPRSSGCRCPPRSCLRARGCRPVTRIFISRTKRCSRRPLTTSETVPRSGF